MDLQTKELEYKGRKLLYRTGGEGPVVVLLHGFGEDGAIWRGQYNAFPHHRLLIPDLPGSGRSEAIDDMTMAGLADAVKAIIEASTPPKGGVADESTTSLESGNSVLVNSPPGRGEVVLIGHSMGGYITLAFAENYPSKLRAVGLFHSTAFADSEEKKETRQKAIRFIEEHGAVEFLKSTTPNLYAPATRQQHPEWIEEHLAVAHNFSAQNLVSYYNAMIQRPDRIQVLKETKVPVLFVLGRHDTAVPLRDGLQQCYLPQLSYIHILEEAGHMGMREEKEKSNALLSQFVNTIEITA